MQKLVQGVHQFQQEGFKTRQDLFERLSSGQSPDTLFITCSDSRIDPALITQTLPGELFVLRNVGNLVPVYDPNGGEAAVVEYAVSALGVKQIVVCGHSLCGAMKGLLHPEQLHALPAVSAWLTHAEDTSRFIRSCDAHGDENVRLNAAIEENVLNQLEHLGTHPAVAERLSQGVLSLHGWVYHIESGAISSYDPGQARFVPLQQPTPVTTLPARRSAVASGS